VAVLPCRCLALQVLRVQVLGRGALGRWMGPRGAFAPSRLVYVRGHGVSNVVLTACQLCSHANFDFSHGIAMAMFQKHEVITFLQLSLYKCVSRRGGLAALQNLYERLFDVITFCVNPGPVRRGVTAKAMHTPAVALQAQNSSDFRKVLAATRASGDISILIDLRRGSVARSAQSTWPGSCTRSSIGRPIG